MPVARQLASFAHPFVGTNNSRNFYFHTSDVPLPKSAFAHCRAQPESVHVGVSGIGVSHAISGSVLFVLFLSSRSRYLVRLPKLSV